MSDDFIIYIDRNINDESQNFMFLFNIYQTWKDVSNSHILFNFTGCNFLRQNAVVFLGGFIRLLQKNRNKIAFNMNSIQPKVKSNLYKNGFLYKLGLAKAISPEEITIPYREDLKLDVDDYIKYLREKWLGKDWLDLDETEKRLVISRIIEAYINVFDHALSDIGVITCGQYYPNMHELRLALVDFGVGIPHNVRMYLNEPNLTASESLKWAFQLNNSTKTNHARGNGLKSLKTFVEQYNGKLEIYSDSGYACIKGQGDIFKDNPIGFSGTLVQISISTIRTDYSSIFDEIFDSNEKLF
jgi:hypothetical protein